MESDHQEEGQHCLGSNVLQHGSPTHPAAVYLDRRNQALVGSTWTVQTDIAVKCETNR